MIILEIAVGVLLARIVGDALGAFIIIQRGKKRKAKAVAQLEQWQALLAEQEKAAEGSPRAVAEITD